MSTSHVESAVTDLLIGQPGPAATALMHWMVTGDHLHDHTPADIGWLAPGVTDPFT